MKLFYIIQDGKAHWSTVFYSENGQESIQIKATEEEKIKVFAPEWIADVQDGHIVFTENQTYLDNLTTQAALEAQKEDLKTKLVEGTATDEDRDAILILNLS